MIVKMDYVTCTGCVKENATFMRKLRNCEKTQTVNTKFLYNYKPA